VTHAILIAPHGADGALAVMVERLTSAEIRVDIVDDAGGAADLARGAPTPPCVLVDLRHVSAGEPEDLKLAAEALRRAAEAVSHARPIAITGEANPSLLVACMRAGAGDILDLRLEGTATARTVVQRIAQQQGERALEASTTSALHAMIEDLLKDLIRTERRSIDLEEQLSRQSGELPSYGETRPPAVLLVEADRHVADRLAERLEAENITTYAFVSGEEAVRDVEAGAMLDVALIAAQLPGMDGLETARRLRVRHAGLQIFLMTSVHDADLAAGAADLGVVGFVHKPLAALDNVVTRLAQLARAALQRTREHLYLERIKIRHVRVLARYRSLPR
jgi:DNA-binding NtrC family response regulator